MYNSTQVKAISFISTMSFIFLFCFIFNITKLPQIFLNFSIASLGYTLLLLGLVNGKKSIRHYIYIVIGCLLIFISTLSLPQGNQSQHILI